MKEKYCLDLKQPCTHRNDDTGHCLNTAHCLHEARITPSIEARIILRHLCKIEKQNALIMTLMQKQNQK